MSLQTGTSLATFVLLLNKISALYGLLAVITGFVLSPLQLSMYIYSFLILVAVAHLAPHIRSQSPFECLVLAWIYLLDTIVNAAYTAVFAVTWFLVISQHHGDKQTGGTPGLGGDMVNDTAGFTSPKYNVSHVEVVAAPASGHPAAQDAVAIGTTASTGPTIPSTSTPSLSHGFLQPESFSSLVAILFLWSIRLYLTLLVLSYARTVLRQYMVSVSRTYNIHNSNADSGYIEDPFASHLPAGFGWRGRVGRALVRVGKGYWLSRDGEMDEGWVPGLASPSTSTSTREETKGVVERERRRRSGTGPAPVALNILASSGGQGQHLRVQELKDVR